MAIAETLAVIAAVTAVASTGASVYASNKQQEAEKKARNTERRTAAIENSRRVRAAIAQRRIQQARIVSAGENQGIGIESSPVSGAQSSLVGDTASNIGGFNNLIAGNQRTADFRFQGARNFAKWRGVSSAFSTVSQLSFAGYDALPATKQPQPAAPTGST